MSKTLHKSLEAKLASLDGPEWDSSDEEMVEPKETTKITKKKKVQQKKKAKGKGQDLKTVDASDASRVIYLGHIPPAFEETQILTFMSQFGKITNVKLSRSRRTGNPRGYAFIEFADQEVAAIVANTMSGYFLMGERRLVCHVMPKDKIHPDLFHGAKENLARSQAGLTSSDYLKKLHDAERKKVNAPKSEEALNKITKRLLHREKKKREQLKTLGIDYDFPGYQACVKKTQTENVSKNKRKVSVDESEEETVDTTEKAQKTPKKAKTAAFETPKKSTKKSTKDKSRTEMKKKSLKKSTSKNRRRSVG